MNRITCALIAACIMTACAAEAPVGQTSRTPQPTATLSQAPPKPLDRDQVMESFAKYQRAKSALRSLIDAKRDCFVAMNKNDENGSRIACDLYRKMVEQTPFDDFEIGVEGLHPYDQNKIKHALVTAAYTGYEYGKKQ